MIYDSPLWFLDIDKVSEDLLELDELAGKSVLLTGATGLICSAVVDVFIRYNETHKSPIHILAAGRQRKSMEARFGKYNDKEYFYYVPYNALKNDNHIDLRADYVIHGAGNASPKAIVAEPVETMLSNFYGLYELLTYAKENGTKRVLYISSSEVYGLKDGVKPYDEGDYGYVDLLNPRNSYSIGKRAAETLCVSFSKEYDIESVIVRPGHIYGPTALFYDDRVSSAFAHAAAKGEKLVMKSDGAQLRSYCHCLDCASAIIKVLLKGKSGQAYNISNPDSICTIAELAIELAQAGNVQLIHEKATKKELQGYNLMQNSSLMSQKLESLGWSGKFSLKQGIRETIAVLRKKNLSYEVLKE